MNNLHTSNSWKQIGHQHEKKKEKEKKRSLFDFMSALWSAPVVKLRQKSDHKHWQTIWMLSYQHHSNRSAVVGPLTRTQITDKPALSLGEEDWWKKKRRVRMLFPRILITMATGLGTRNNAKSLQGTAVKTLKSLYIRRLSNILNIISLLPGYQKCYHSNRRTSLTSSQVTRAFERSTSFHETRCYLPMTDLLLLAAPRDFSPWWRKTNSLWHLIIFIVFFKWLTAGCVNWYTLSQTRHKETIKKSI